jgi:hypothetical protein
MLLAVEAEDKAARGIILRLAVVPAEQAQAVVVAVRLI